MKRGLDEKNRDALNRLNEKFVFDHYMLEDDERRGVSSMKNFLHFFDRYEIEDELHIDEKVFWQGEATVSQNFFIRAFCFIFFLGAFIGFLFFFFKSFSGHTGYRLNALVLLFISLCIFISLIKIKRKKKYAITDKRIIILDNVESKSIKLERIVETKPISNGLNICGSVMYVLHNANPDNRHFRIADTGINNIRDYVYVHAVLDDAILKRRSELGVEAPADDKIQENPFNILSPDEINSKFDSMLESDEKIVYSSQEVSKYQLREISGGGDTSNQMIIMGTASLFTIILFFVKWYYALFPFFIVLLVLSGFIFKEKQRLTRVYTDNCFAITNKRIMFAHGNYKKAFAYSDIEFLPAVRCDYDCGYIHYGTLTSRFNGRMTEVYRLFVDEPEKIQAIINKATHS